MDLQRFLTACRDEPLDAARHILGEHPELTSASVHAAAAAADESALARLIDGNASLATRPDAAGWPPLVYVCWTGFHTISPEVAAASVRCTARLLDAGADVNTSTPVPAGVDGGMLSVLYRACERDNAGIVRLLLERGADPNDGESVYHAAQRGHLECLDLLLAHKAEISARHPHWNNTPLFFLAGHADDDAGRAPWLAGFRWLLAHGADPNVSSYDARETPLHKLVTQPRTLAAIDTLLEFDVHVEKPRADGRTAYALAVRAGNDAAAQRLVARGARTEVVGTIDRLLGACARGDRADARQLAASEPAWRSSLSAEDRGALVNTIWTDRVDAVRLYIELGFDLSWEGSWGGTPLHHAAWLGKPELVRLLIDAGAPVNARDSRFGSSALGWAAHGSANHRKADEDYIAVVDRLIDAGATREAAINKLGEGPEALGSAAVAARLRARALA